MAPFACGTRDRPFPYLRLPPPLTRCGLSGLMRDCARPIADAWPVMRIAETASHSECIQRTRASVLSRTVSSSGLWKMSPQMLATVAPTCVKKKASGISRLSRLYCFARRTADGEATRPARPSLRLWPCYPNLPWWDGPLRQTSCRAASYSARFRVLAQASPHSAA